MIGHRNTLYRIGSAVLGLACGAAALGLYQGQVVAESTGTQVPVPPAPDLSHKDPRASGLALAKYIERFDTGWVDSYAKVKVVLYDAQGDKVAREIMQMTLEGAEGDKMISRFLSPAELRGVSVLNHDHVNALDDSWVYLPSSRRTRRISGAARTASFQGTEFTYEDLSAFSAQRYQWRLLGVEPAGASVDNAEAYQLEATPKSADSGYSKLIMYVRREGARTERIEFFDQAGKRLKTLTASRWKRFHGRFWRATKIEMANHQTGKRTVLDTTALLVDLARYRKGDGSPRSNLTASNFTKRALTGR